MKKQYEITHAGSQMVKAPQQSDAKRGTAVVKTGTDLRTGKK